MQTTNKLLLLISALLPAMAVASEAWVDVNVTSLHTKTTEHLNQRNLGAGVEYQALNQVIYLGGAYRNSFNRTSSYALAGWTPVRFGAVQAGLVAGAISGYSRMNNGGMSAAVAGLVRIEGARVGMNIFVIPPSMKDSPVTVGFQLKVKIL